MHITNTYYVDGETEISCKEDIYVNNIYTATIPIIEEDIYFKNRYFSGEPKTCWRVSFFQLYGLNEPKLYGHERFGRFRGRTW